MDSKSDNLGVDKGDVDPCQKGDGAVLSIYRIQVTRKKMIRMKKNNVMLNVLVYNMVEDVRREESISFGLFEGILGPHDWSKDKLKQCIINQPITLQRTS